jgi:hypothetical protein
MTKKKSPEQLEQEQLVRQINELDASYIPEPPRNFIFDIGDRVQHGNIKKSFVRDVLDGGKKYLLEETCTENNYGMPYEYNRKMYVSWLDIHPYFSTEQIENKQILTRQEDQTLFINGYQTSISNLFSKVYFFGLDTDTDYQRGNVWKESDKVDLIDSIFNNINIGSFYIIQRPYKTNGKLFEVLDGKQRIDALCQFYECRIKYKNKYFKYMHPFDRRHFKNFYVTINMVKHIDGEDLTDAQKYKLFLKANTTGHNQDQKHIKYVKKLLEKAENQER